MKLFIKVCYIEVIKGTRNYEEEVEELESSTPILPYIEDEVRLEDEEENQLFTNINYIAMSGGVVGTRT